MDYYTWLAVQQNTRYLNFKNSHKDFSEQEARYHFFGLRYEINISHSITNGIAAHAAYDRHPH